MKQTIFFLRHGQTDYNLKGIIQGSGVDSSLNDTGRKQARLFFDKYQNEDFEVVITSALQRTHQTVQHFIEGGIRHEATADINEINWGVHEGEKYDEWMKVGYTKLLEDWSNEKLESALEGGESGRSLIERCSRFLKYLSTLSEKKILVCSHGRTLRCLVMLMKEQHPRAMEEVRHANTGLYLAHLENGKFELVKENDTSHLVTLES